MRSFLLRVYAHLFIYLYIYEKNNYISYSGKWSTSVLSISIDAEIPLLRLIDTTLLRIMNFEWLVFFRQHRTFYIFFLFFLFFLFFGRNPNGAYRDHTLPRILNYFSLTSFFYTQRIARNSQSSSNAMTGVLSV